MKTIYVGMALSGAPEVFREEFQHTLKEQLRTIPEVSVLDFFWTAVGREAGNDKEVYTYDKDQAESADLAIFILDHPSIGLGMEIQLRAATKRPSLYFVHRQPPSRVSRMVLGYIATADESVTEYESVADIVRRVRRFLDAGV